jgi:hypothetical protein
MAKGLNTFAIRPSQRRIRQHQKNPKNPMTTNAPIGTNLGNHYDLFHSYGFWIGIILLMIGLILIRLIKSI